MLAALLCGVCLILPQAEIQRPPRMIGPPHRVDYPLVGARKGLAWAVELEQNFLDRESGESVQSFTYAIKYQVAEVHADVTELDVESRMIKNVFGGESLPLERTSPARSRVRVAPGGPVLSQEPAPDPMEYRLLRFLQVDFRPARPGSAEAKAGWQFVGLFPGTQLGAVPEAVGRWKRTAPPKSPDQAFELVGEVVESGPNGLRAQVRLRINGLALESAQIVCDSAPMPGGEGERYRLVMSLRRTE